MLRMYIFCDLKSLMIKYSLDTCSKETPSYQTVNEEFALPHCSYQINDCDSEFPSFCFPERTLRTKRVKPRLLWQLWFIFHHFGTFLNALHDHIRKRPCWWSSSIVSLLPAATASPLSFLPLQVASVFCPLAFLGQISWDEVLQIRPVVPQRLPLAGSYVRRGLYGRRHTAGVTLLGNKLVTWGPFFLVTLLRTAHVVIAFTNQPAKMFRM